MLYGRESNNLPSRFIDEIDDKYIERRDSIKDNTSINIDKMYVNGGNDDLNKGDTIYHETLGNGVILSVDGDMIEVAFKVGVKKLLKNHKSIKKV
jgi:hypothetical protein